MVLILVFSSDYWMEAWRTHFMAHSAYLRFNLENTERLYSEEQEKEYVITGSTVG